jgi:ribosomal protein L29
MPLDSDIFNADEQLQVEFYIAKDVDPKWDGKPFVRINIPGDKTTIIEQPVTEEHKKRFPRQYLYFQMKQNEQDAPAIGTSLDVWFTDGNGDITRGHIEELRILKFQTVEQVASASDAQLQRIGMGGTGLREKAKAFLARRNRSETENQLDETKKQLAELQAQMAALMARKPGRPKREPAVES